ncbi:MAG TPA: hypothetical protein VM164_05965 [Burkholderiales bacterium]|nr:hypothetical protein [Burkholderiales bacterium]
MNILDPRFKYTSAISTDVMSTWKKFGFNPPTEAERISRQGEIDAARAAPQRHTQVPDFLRGERASGAH